MTEGHRIELTPVRDEDDPNDHYPPKGTPEEAIIFNLNEYQYFVAWHTGRYFHGQCVCAGFKGEEVGVSDIPTDPGVWFFSGGKVWEHKDWETGYADDYGISGNLRKATPEDFEKAGLECPMEFSGGRIVQGDKAVSAYTKLERENQALRAVLDLWEDSLRVDALMSGPVARVSHSKAQIAWKAHAALKSHEDIPNG